MHALHPENVRLLPYQPKEGLAESLAAADLHLVPLRRGVHGCLVPSKVYGILAVGRPFVAMMEEQAEVAMIAREYSAGYVTPPDDAEALGAVIRRARQEPGELAPMGQRARWAAESHFDRRMSVAKFAAVLRNVVAAGNAGRLYVPDVESARVLPKHSPRNWKPLPDIVLSPLTRRLKPRATKYAKPACAGSQPRPRKRLCWGGESPPGDLGLFVAREFIRRVHRQASVASWFVTAFWAKSSARDNPSGELAGRRQRSC